MRISQIEMAGFRGIKDKLTLEVPAGFLVISGQNGTGKSTICDAIEYAITGTISRPGSRAEKGETIDDYIWWRGPGQASAHYASIDIQTDDGKKFQLKRTPNGLHGIKQDEISSLICSNPNKQKYLEQLGLTSIFRAESIAQLSLDLPEADRFSFVCAAIGTDDLEQMESKLRTIHATVKERENAIEKDYFRARESVTAISAQLSEARAESARAIDTEAAEQRLREEITLEAAKSEQILTEARKIIAELRLQESLLKTHIEDFRSIAKQAAETKTAAYIEHHAALELSLSTKQSERRQLETQLTTTRTRISEANQEGTADLLLLAELGRRIGLQEGHCPLCGSRFNPEEYATHLAETERIARQKSGVLAGLVIQEKTLQSQITISDREISELLYQIERSKSLVITIEERSSKLKESVGQLGVETFTEEAILEASEALGSKAQNIEKDVRLLYASGSFARVSELEQLLSATRERSDRIADELSRTKVLSESLREAIAVTQRTSGEIVDERLAALSPLLSELYTRLRPHVDWQEVAYHIRGDVKRFLSLRVGDNLNPRFMFSSGQRRVVGLAFLLSVHLTRSWCNLRSLVLDDPVQHIDDFRALHLVELLTGIRRIGQQIICTVEDPSLAELLVRRLRSSDEYLGSQIELQYSAGTGIGVKAQKTIRPFPRQILLSA
jgi:chromosome segregation protein